MATLLTGLALASAVVGVIASAAVGWSYVLDNGQTGRWGRVTAWAGTGALVAYSLALLVRDP